MIKNLKLSGLNPKLVGFYPANCFLFTPGVNVISKVVRVILIKSVLRLRDLFLGRSGLVGWGLGCKRVSRGSHGP